VEGECITTDVRTAELCKLTENSFRDVNIAFANELSVICDTLGVDVWELIRLANRHPRVNILQPGPGVGGHCIAVDPWFIVSQAPQDARLIRTAREVNDSKPRWVCDKVDQLVEDVLQASGKERGQLKIACFGLAFKANIDDLRESPALAITLDIATRYPGQIVAVEPHIQESPQSLQDAGVELVDFSSAATADVLVFLVDHRVFNEESLLLQGRQRLLDTRGSMAIASR
jgi:UDP-N-acetyl-D-mannosaminuronic acid dehydrogenase